MGCGHPYFRQPFGAIYRAHIRWIGAGAGVAAGGFITLVKPYLPLSLRSKSMPRR